MADVVLDCSAEHVIEDMSVSKDSHPTSISQATSLEEIAEYWDSHSLADHWDQTAEVDVEVRLQPRTRRSRTMPSFSIRR